MPRAAIRTRWRQAAVGVAAALLGIALPFTASAETPSAQRMVARMIGDISGASSVTFDAKATNGLELDALKVIQGPRPGSFLGVFDSVGPHNQFVTRLAESSDLTTWSAGPILSLHASMPTIAYASGGYLVAFESEGPNGDSQIEIEHFHDLAALRAARPDRSLLLPRELSPANERTPSIEVADLAGGLSSSRIVIGFHYNSGDGLDRNGIGVLSGFGRWSESRNVPLNHAIEADGVRGSIGDRDAVTIGGLPVELVGGQVVKHNWASWHVFAYDPAAGSAIEVPIATPRGPNLSIAVPRASIVRNSEKQFVLVLSAFVYTQGSPPGTPGELLWWRLE